MITSYEDRLGFLQHFHDGSLAIHIKNPVTVHVKENGWELTSIKSPFAMFNGVVVTSSRKEIVDEVMAALAEHEIPADIRLVGPGISQIHRFEEHGYRNLGGTPFMMWRADDSADSFQLREGLSVRRLVTEDLETMCAIYADVYGMNEAVIAEFKRMLFVSPDDYTYGLFKNGEMVSLVTAIVYQDSVGIWSMGTPTIHQKNGYGQQLLMTVMQEHKKMGTNNFYLYASAAGKHLYDKCGWTTLDYIPYLSKVSS
jgi:GNAT superfamily N-acetyltransferase